MAESRRYAFETSGWLGRPGIRGISEFEVSPDGRGIRVRLVFVTAVDAALALAAVVRCLRPAASSRMAPDLTFASGLPEQAASLAPLLHDVHRADETSDRHLRRSDVLLVGERREPPDIARVATIVIAEDRWTRDGADFEVCVDPTIHRPLGRRSSGDRTVATAIVTGATMTVSASDTAISIVDTVTAANARALRSVAAIVTTQSIPQRLRRQLKACGVVLSTSVSALPSANDDLAWQALSVQERRHALRQYGPAAVLDGWPSVSVLLCTDRPDHLEQAMAQLSGLRYPRLEIAWAPMAPQLTPLASGISRRTFRIRSRSSRSTVS